LKVLLLHSDDTFPLPGPTERWDLIVDFARAPATTHESWSQQASCPVFSLYRFAEEIEDLHRLRQLLRLGTGRMVDQWGIDWWDVLSLEIVPQLQQFMLAHRLSKELRAGCELYSTRPHPLAAALQRLLGARLTILESRFQSIIHWAHHYREVFSHLDTAQLAQVLEDKLDGMHSIRRSFASRRRTSGRPVILLPSAYVNVSRTAVAYAKLLPDHQFLLVLTRRNGKIPSLPANVRLTSLSPYFVSSDQREIASLIELWNGLRKQLVDGADVFRTADGAGVLGRIPALLSWGIALRDAWSRLFESENVTACLSADDSNPPSNIPLILAKKHGLPALACHHGALNYAMAIKVNHADSYLVKSEMERDYVSRICHVRLDKIAIVVPSQSQPSPLQGMARRTAPWLVFFTEPYQSYWWRRDEVYRDLLPRLWALAQTCGLRLVFKLHPFESVTGHRRMLRRLIPEHERQIEVVAGAPSDQLWNNTQFALTVQSSTALECAALGIPVFLCSWLRDPFSGYVRQYARFGVGHELKSSEQIAEIHGLLAGQNRKHLRRPADRVAIGSDELLHPLSGACAFPLASDA
jgi:hypothetical protein